MKTKPNNSTDWQERFDKQLSIILNNFLVCGSLIEGSDGSDDDFNASMEFCFGRDFMKRPIDDLYFKVKEQIKAFISSELQREREKALEEVEKIIETQIPRYLKGGEIRNQYFVKGWNELRHELLSKLNNLREI